MNFKRFHESKNLFDGTLIGGVFTDADWTISPTVSTTTFKSIKVYLSAGTYTFGFEIPVNIVRTVIDGQYAQAYDTNVTSYTITITANGYVGISFRANASSTEPWNNSNIMLNTGSTALPYEPYSSEVWHDIPYYQHKTATDTLSLPAVIYPNDTSITVGIKGQSSQSGTPSPSNPVDVVGVGELETSGEHAGQYKIPISNGQTTTPIYLGSTQSARNIKKVDLSSLNWTWNAGSKLYSTRDLTDILYTSSNLELGYGLAEKYKMHIGSGMSSASADNCLAIDTSMISVHSESQTSPSGYFYYVLRQTETAAVNEPLMKIGTYSDSISGISLPTTDGANTITVDTTVQPSEFTATWTGWHNASVKEKSENLFDYQTMAVSDENSYLNSDGTIGTSNDWNITEYIPCDGTSFTVGDIGGNTPAICLYNANKEYITGKSYNTGGTYSKQAINITSQTTAKFIRFSYCKGSLNPDDLSAIMLNTGSTAIPYEPYWK